MSSILRPSLLNHFGLGSFDPLITISHFFLLDFGSMNSLRGGIPQVFFQFFFLCALPTQMDKVHIFSAGLETKSVLVLDTSQGAFLPPPHPTLFSGLSLR